MKLIRKTIPLALFCLATSISHQVVAQSPATSDLQPGEFIKEWLVLGPIVLYDGEEAPGDDSAHKTSFQTDLLKDAGGEASITPQEDESIKIDDHELKWSVFETDKQVIDLREATGAKQWSIAYAFATVNSEEDVKTYLGIGSDDAIRVWLNGELIHDNWTGRSVVLDDDFVPAMLNKGENRILLKVYNGILDWGFACRFLSPKELTTHLIKAAAQRKDEQIRDILAAGADIDAKNKDGITAYLAARMKGNEKTARLLEDLGADKEVDFDPRAFIRSRLMSHTSPGKPGIAVLVSQGDEILLREGFGTASIEHDVPITPDTKFRIGSVTKQFTAAAILKLQEDGHLSVTDKLSDFISDFPRGDEVTLHHLLTHTSGLKSFTSKPDFYATAASATTEQEMVDSFKGDKFDFDPGEKFAYCNTGYFLLGHIVGKVSGMSFGEYLKKTFFDPLEMHDTGIHESTAIYKHEATGYSWLEGQITKAMDWDMSRAGGAGALYSTVNDLHQWNAGIFVGKVLNAESLRAAHTVNEVKEQGTLSMPYGYGWMMDEHRGLKRISHSGGLNGFVSQLSYYPDQEVTVVALHNAMPQMPGLIPGAICNVMAEVFLWKKMQARPKYELAKDVDPMIYDDYLGRYDYQSAVLTVTREGDKLMAQLTGQAKFEIYPAGDDKFFWKVVDAQVEFIRDTDGQVTAARHTQGVAKFTAPRMEEKQGVEVSSEILDRYVGKYSYPGQQVLTIRRQDNQLLAKMTGQGEAKIFPESETVFFWKIVNAQIEFVMDDEGHVTGVIHRQAGVTLDVKRIE